MKKLFLFLLTIATLTISTLPMSALALSPDTSAKSLVCLDRRYNFLTKDNYVAMASGGEHVALIRDDASLWMFGSNLDGRLGIGSIRNAYNAPIKVLENVARVKTKPDATIAIKNDGTAWFFGKNAGSVPTKAFDNVLDADHNDISAYVDTSGNAHYIYYNNEEGALCGGASEIYVLDNSGGDGLKSSGGSSNGVLFIDSMSDILSKPIFFIAVLKSNGDLYEYAIDRYGNANEGELVVSGVKGITAVDSSVILDMGGGKFLTGSTSSGLEEVNIPGCVEYSRHGFYKKSDGTVWREYNNECVGENVKLFASVGGGMGVFMVHNDNSVSAYSINKNSDDYAARLNAVNGSWAVMDYNDINADDIHAKVREICGSETDSYINAKNISKWIGKNITYQESGHDQSGVEAFRTGTGVCMAFASLTKIMCTYADIPTFVCTSIVKDHAWNIAIIDGVTVFIDNTGSYTDDSFDMGMFSRQITDNGGYNYSPYDSWAATEIRGAYDWDIIDRGLPSDYKNAINRDEFCQIVRATIERAKGKDISSVIAEQGESSIASPFTDTTDADVIAMYKLGIVNGTSATTFAPDMNISREEAAKIMCGLAATLGEETNAPAAAFPDNDNVSAWARDSVNFVSHRGIMKGKPDGFDPKNTISIQESILICYRYLGTVLE